MAIVTSSMTPRLPTVVHSNFFSNAQHSSLPNLGIMRYARDRTYASHTVKERGRRLKISYKDDVVGTVLMIKVTGIL